MEVSVKSLTLQQAFFEIDKNVRIAFVQKQLDKQRLIWPHFEEQTPWLIKSLRVLDEITLEAVKSVDKAWQERRLVVSDFCSGEGFS